MACHKDTYVNRFRLVDKLRDKGCFVLNCSWTDEELTQKLPASLRKAVADKQADFYVIDAQAIARKVGLGVRVNMIMETVFFKLSGVMDFDTAVAGLKKEITAAYMHEGGDVVQKNLQAVDMAVEALRKVDVPAEWGSLSRITSSATAAFSQQDAMLTAIGFSSTFGAVYQIGRECPAWFLPSPLTAGCLWAQRLTKSAASRLMCLNGTRINVLNAPSVHWSVHMLPYARSCLMPVRCQRLLPVWRRVPARVPKH